MSPSFKVLQCGICAAKWTFKNDHQFDAQMRKTTYAHKHFLRTPSWIIQHQEVTNHEVFNFSHVNIDNAEKSDADLAEDLLRFQRKEYYRKLRRGQA